MNVILTKEVISNIVNTCERIIDLEEFNINMKVFKSTNMNNEISYCIIGRLASLEYDDVSYIDYLDYSDRILGAETCSSAEEMKRWKKHTYSVWGWLFSNNWPNNLEHAKKRAEILLKYIDVIDERFNFSSASWSSINLDTNLNQVTKMCFSKYDIR